MIPPGAAARAPAAAGGAPTETAAAEPQVPGAGFSRPTPKKVAIMRSISITPG